MANLIIRTADNGFVIRVFGDEEEVVSKEFVFERVAAAKKLVKQFFDELENRKNEEA